MTARKPRADRVVDLFEYLVDNPDGVTIEQIADYLGVTRVYAMTVVQGLRDLLGDTDTINVPCDPNPADPNGRWLYKVVGTLDEVQGWASNRIGDTERRLRTQHQVIASVVSGTDGRTVEGRKARLMKRSLGRLIEDLDDLASAP